MKTVTRMAQGSSTARRLLAASAAVALVLVGAVGPVQASQPTAASGTVIQTAITSLEVRFAGPNIILEQTTAGSVSGTLSGSYQDSFTVVIHPNGTFSAHGTLTCACTVDGKSGVVELALTNTGEILNGIPTFEGRYAINGGTGELAGLRGVLEFEGAVDLQTGLSTSTYSGQIHSHP